MRYTIYCVLALTFAAPAAAQQGEPATTTRETTLHSGPDGRAQARLQQGTVVEVVARERGWVRVRTEGWVRATDVAAAESELLGIRSAADLRADPLGTRGKLVRWDVEVISLQNADPLRGDLAIDEPYMLVRGPATENSLLYVAVPGYLLPTVRALPALARITMVARVRIGRSEPVGIPVLDLESVTRRP
jgi:hypothetical protein